MSRALSLMTRPNGCRATDHVELLRFNPGRVGRFPSWPKVSVQESRVALGSKTADSLGLPDCVLVRLPGQPSDIARATKFLALTHALLAMANTDLVGIRGR